MDIDGGRATAHDRERGASAVEMALVLPLFLMLVFGMLTGGLAYYRQISLTHAAREGVRVGATAPTGKVAIADAWFDDIAERAVLTAGGELGAGVPGRYSCVAYIGYASPNGSTTDWTEKREQTGSDPATYTAGQITDPTSWCFDDGLGADGAKRRVQVVLKRSTDLHAILFSQTLTLRGFAVARFEAVSP